MPDDTEAELIRRCRDGDRAAFDALLAPYLKALFGATYRILHHREDAIDVIQTALLRAYENFGRYDAGQPFRGWMYRIAVNEALDVARRRRGAEALADESADERDGPDATAIQQQSEAAMQRALMTIKLDYRVVIVLKHLQGCSYEEMATILACPVKTVKSRLFTARQALRDVLVADGRLP